MSERPLSHTKRGKLLAALGGLAGGPLGVIVSPLVLMLINATKKKGNRFLFWFLLGIPISLGLLITQYLLLVFVVLVIAEINAAERNGMPDWSKLENAQELMKNPDWCIHKEVSITEPVPDVRMFTCYSSDLGAPAINSYKVIECKTEPYGDTYHCHRLPNSKFMEKEIIENKKKFG